MYCLPKNDYVIFAKRENIGSMKRKIWQHQTGKKLDGCSEKMFQLRSQATKNKDVFLNIR